MIGKLISKITGSGISKVVDSVGSIIDNVTTSDDEKLKAKQELLKIQTEYELELKKMELEGDKLFQREIDGKLDIIKAEIKSDDKFVRRFRPLMGYLFISAFIFLLVIFGLPIALGYTVAIPEAFMELVAILGEVFKVFLGIYAIGRSGEKALNNINFNKLKDLQKKKE